MARICPAGTAGGAFLSLQKAKHPGLLCPLVSVRMGAQGVRRLPAGIQLPGMEVSLVNAMSRETVLRQYLNTVKGAYGLMNW